MLNAEADRLCNVNVEKIHEKIESWGNRAVEDEVPYVCLEGIVSFRPCRRTWRLGRNIHRQSCEKASVYRLIWRMRKENGPAFKG
jgi:hypothetical protein